MRRRASNQNGFTLLEILVGLIVIGFLVAGLAQGIRFGLFALGRQNTRVARQSDLDAADRVLRQVIVDADPGEVNGPPTVQGGAHTLRLMTRLPPAAGFQGQGAEVAIGVDPDHRLVVRALPHPHAERLTPLPPPRLSVLAEGVDHVDFDYWRPISGQSKVAGWVPAWTSDGAPGLIRVKVVFQAKDRHWPDIVDEPRRDPFGAP